MTGRAGILLYRIGRPFQGYKEFDENAERITAIAQIFPVFFFLLAALISLTTMTRMVDEGRNQIGTLKALGYGNFPIAMKYFVYAFIATVAGGIIGLLLGYWIFPTVIMDAYSSMYNLPSADTQFYWSYAVISITGALLATGLSTLVSVRLSLRSNAAALLKPKALKKVNGFFWNTCHLSGIGSPLLKRLRREICSDISVACS
ncbi:MAG: ABC transporter permease [Alkalibacterium thalassium]|nr:ABC transporter permease [Alkalibacterium thalassium]